MRRRTTLTLLAAPSLAFPVGAHAAERPYVLGFLQHHDRTLGEPILRSVLDRLKSRGHEQGRDYILEARYGERSLERIEQLARELVALNPTVIVGPGNVCAEALKRATRTIPIVAWGVNAPVETGLVQSLAHPGGNVTGTTFSPPETAGKLLETLRAAATSIRRVVVVVNPAVPGLSAYTSAGERTAQALGLEVVYHTVRRAEDFSAGELDRARPDALYVTADQVLSAITPVLIQYALRRKLPSIGVLKRFATAGGLMALGADPDEIEGSLVDLILRIVDGAAPATLPVRQPARLNLVLNRATAQAIGLTLSQEILLRAQEVVG